MNNVMKRILAIALSVIAIFSLVGCSGAGNGEGGSASAELEELKSALEEQGKKLEALEKENEELKEKIADSAYWQNAPYGVTCSLDLAYCEGWLSREDIMSIAYYQNKGRARNEEFMPEDYQPAEQEPLSTDMERKIRETVAYNLRNSDRSIPYAKAADVSIDQYYGHYGNAYAVMISDAYTEYDTAIWEINLGGLTLYYTNGNRIVLFFERNCPEVFLMRSTNSVRTYWNLTEDYQGTEEKDWQALIRNQEELGELVASHAALSAETFTQYNEQFFEKYALVVLTISCSVGVSRLAYLGVTEFYGSFDVKVDLKENETSSGSKIIVAFGVWKSDAESVTMEGLSRIRVKAEYV